jgi:hypothetical protein
MASKRQTVTVCRGGITALEEPRILFEANGKLYLSLAVAEYDPKHSQLSEAQKATIRDLGNRLDNGQPARAVGIDLGSKAAVIIGANTVGPIGPGL